MALERIMVTDFSFGEVSARYAGRMATELRTKSLEYIEGFRLGADGGVVRRHGSMATRITHPLAVSSGKLYDAEGIPSFVLWRNDDDRVLGLISDVGTDPTWYRYVMDAATATPTTTVISNLEQGVHMGTTGTFHDPETDAEYVHIWTDGDSFDFATATPQTITRRDQVDLAIVYQNRLIGLNRSTGELHMSKVMDLFDFTDQGPQSIFYELGGTASADAGGLTLTGSLTQFSVDLNEGDDIRVGTGGTSDRRTIDTITSDTVLTVTETFLNAHSGDTVYLVTDGLADPRPLYALPDWAGAETPKWLVSRQSVYIGTDQAEYEVFSSYPYFDREAGGLMIRRITDIGSEHATYLGPGLAVQSKAHTMLIRYTGQAFEYQAGGLTDRVDNNRLVTVQSVEFGTHRYLLVLDVDGVLWCYMSNPAAGVDGWCELAHDIGWVFVHGKDVYVAIERDAAWSIEVLPLDTVDHPNTRTKRQAAMFFANDAYGEQGGYLIYDGTDLTGDKLEASSTVDVYTISLTNKTSTYVGQATTDANGVLDITDEALETLIGYTSGEAYLYAHTEDLYPDGELRTLPLGGIIGSRSRISKVVLQVYASTGAKVRVNTGTWEEYTCDTPESGTWEFRVEHNQEEEPRVTIETVDARPLNIYQILVEVDIGG